MKIKFHGAVEGVTGSCYELWDEDLAVHILVDCGMFQGEPTHEMRNAGPLPYVPRDLTHVLLTHAHLDHVGMLPRLYKEGFAGSVYTLNETQALAKAILGDAARIGAPYKESDIDRIKWHEPANAVFGNYCRLEKDVLMRFFRSGHILGAASISVLWGPRASQKSITFSGDIGVNADEREVMPLLGYRMSPERADYLVVESTYGGKVRPPLTMEDRLGALKTQVDAGLFERGGVIVMPAFSIGRTQEIICDLSLIFAREPERYADIPVYTEGRLGNTAGRILAQHIDRTYKAGQGTKIRNAWLGAGMFRACGLDKDDPDDMDMIVDCLRETFAFEPPKVARRGFLEGWRCITRQAPKVEAIKGPAIIIAGSGMCDAGPIQRHLKDHLHDPTATVLFTGYCGGSTLGGRLIGHGELPATERRRNRAPIAVNGETFEARHIAATIERLTGYSAHADQAGLLDWMWSAKPGETPRCIGKTVIITHGEIDQRRHLAETIKARAAAAGEAVVVEIPDKAGMGYEL